VLTFDHLPPADEEVNAIELEVADVQPARTFAERIGGDPRREAMRCGEREFVEAPAPVATAAVH